MKKYKLTIGILPKGAWGNDLSKTLSAKDWNEIKMNCYKKARHKCSICGFVTNDLDAHEVWEFDILSKTQILKDIIPICSKCHGVKHIKNSLRLGFEEKAKKHFIDVNNCSEFDFYSELARVIIEYNELNQIYRWKIKADLSKYTNKKIEIKIQQNEEKGKIRVSVFNTGDNIKEEHLDKIWGRFYKEDSSRNRSDGGTGIGLALVKAIMNNYKNDYGVINKDNGVEFYFELDLKI